MLKLDGYDDCILGRANGIAISNLNDDGLLIYSTMKIIDKLKLEMTEEEAIEFFEFNILGAYMGTGTPIFLDDVNDWEDE